MPDFAAAATTAAATAALHCVGCADTIAGSIASHSTGTAATATTTERGGPTQIEQAVPSGYAGGRLKGLGDLIIFERTAQKTAHLCDMRVSEGVVELLRDLLEFLVVVG